MNEQVICPSCNGVGHWLLASMGTAKVCPKCNGTGKVPTKQVVCPKPEQMMICPKAGECNLTKNCKPAHSEPHIKNDVCELVGNPCPACIPVPSTPASDHIGDGDKMVAQYGTNVAQATPASEMVCKCGHSLAEHYEGGGDVTYCEHSDCACKVFVPLPPDELLKFNNALEADALDWDTRNLILDQIEQLSNTFYNKYSGKGLEVMELHKSEYWESIINLILLKCHQSEAAKIKQLELGKKLSMESDNRIEQAIGKVLGYPAYKDDQKNFPNATESNGVCVGDHVAESLVMELVDRFKAIRADQNKKIATWIQKNDNHFIFHFIPECGGDFCFLATEGMENECAEPDEGAGYCQYRDKCRYANKQLLFGQNFIAKLQKGDSPE